MRPALLLALAAWLSYEPSARAWEKHQVLMPAILRGLADPSSGALSQPLRAPCPSEDTERFTRLAFKLQLNPHPKDGIRPTAAEACARKLSVTGKEILAGVSVDEPDGGMDQDLPYPPESYDPDHFQKWMGGTTGPSSQGFRHMYFGGWQLWHPLNTFQIPTHAVGLGPQRVAFMANQARDLIQGGGRNAAWGYRILGWAIHYAQDLAQPFHATQIPALELVPWYSLLHWPPAQGFNDLVQETTRTIANYHWAYEDYTYTRVIEEHSPYAECLENPDAHSVLVEDALREEAYKDPLLLADRVARASTRLAPKVGEATLHFFGSRLKQHGVDLRFKQGVPDYADLTVRPDLVEQREELRQVTCVALANAAWATRALIQWATGHPLK